MLNRLRIENFKAWKDTGDIELAPITIFFGTNSSGKSSLAQALLLLQQTAQSSDRRRILHLGDHNSTIDLGTFSDIVHGHAEDESIRFELGWYSPDSVQVKDARSELEVEGHRLTFATTIGQRDGKLHVAEMHHALFAGDDRLEIGMRAKPRKPGEYQLTQSGYRPIHNPGRKWSLPPPTRFYGFPDEAVAYYQNTDFLPDFNLALEGLMSSLHYVGPLREYPKRLYLWSGEEPLHVGTRGERAVEALLAGRGRTMNRKYKERHRSLQVIVADWLQRMKLIESFEVRPIAKGRKEYEVILRTRGARAEVKLTDVGFGLSQILPVIVESFYVKPHSTVIFEQPEIHLHPSVQADLADLLLEAIHMREHGDDRQLQFIVESHSEHFLRRLQRRVAEGSAKPEDVVMYFCEPGEQGSTIRRLELDDYGRITNWPEDFFGDMIGDVAAQTRSAIARMKAANDG